MTDGLHPHWQAALAQEFGEPYFRALTEFVTERYAQHECYPPTEKIFAALNLCPPDKVRAVIIGQDPYHGPGQANGLCFSVNPNVPVPASLRNIFLELEAEYPGRWPATSGDLTHWARQGVLLLNATLTVSAHKAGSHQKQGWERFTDAVIRYLSDKREGIAFMLWGNYARSKGKLIDSGRHLILESGHPSPLSANQGKWFGNGHFIKANDYLISRGTPPIEW